MTTIQQINIQPEYLSFKTNTIIRTQGLEDDRFFYIIKRTPKTMATIEVEITDFTQDSLIIKPKLYTTRDGEITSWNMTKRTKIYNIEDDEIEKVKLQLSPFEHRTGKAVWLYVEELDEDYYGENREIRNDWESDLRVAWKNGDTGTEDRRNKIKIEFELVRKANEYFNVFKNPYKDDKEKWEYYRENEGVIDSLVNCLEWDATYYNHQIEYCYEELKDIIASENCYYKDKVELDSETDFEDMVEQEEQEEQSLYVMKKN